MRLGILIAAIPLAHAPAAPPRTVAEVDSPGRRRVAVVEVRRARAS